MPSEPCRVFISYARKDGAALAQQLQSDLGNQGFDVWLDRQRIGGGAVWSMEIEHEIDTRQVALALLSPGSYVSEICRAEQLRALDKGNRLIPVLAVKGSDRPLYLYARQYRDFTDDRNYDVSLGELIEDIRGDVTATLPDAYRKTTVKYLTAPPQVTNYLERPEALRALRDTLFSEDQRQPIALTALAGMGGIGKTVLAKAITDDEVVQRAFPDGIVWITAGKGRKRDFVEDMRQIAEVLGDDTNTGKKITDWKDEYRIRIANKAALIVVDDVWSKTDIEPLLAESPRSRFLFTTRDAAIGRFVGAHQHRADLLDLVQSRELLALWANVPIAKLPATAEEVIAECGQLPLALSVVGAMLRGADAKFWKDTLDLLKKADLSAIQEQLPEGQESFFKAIEISFQSLKPDMRERYRALAVLLEDMAAPLHILEILWNVNESEARRISRHFVDRSLAQSDASLESIRLHDLQLDYVRARHPDKKALDLIQRAIRLSSHVIARDPAQFASQMIGRLLPYQDIPAVGDFTKRVADGTRAAWLRPLTASLTAERSVRWLKPEEETLSSVAFSRNGRWAAHASSSPGSAPDNVVLWDLKEWRSLGAHFRALPRLNPFALALSDDARWCLYADSIGGVHRLGAAGEVWEGHAHRNVTIACWLGVSTDGKRGLSACQHGRLVAWDIDADRHEIVWDESENYIRALSLDPTGTRAVVARADGSVRVLELWPTRERILCTLDGEPTALATSVDNTIVVAAAASGRIEVRLVESSESAVSSFSTEDEPSAVAVSADGRYVAVGTAKGTVEVWAVASALRTARYSRAHTYEVKGIAFSHDGSQVLSADALQIKEWALEAPDEQESSSSRWRAAGQVKVTANGLHAVAVLEDGRLGVWKLRTGEPESALPKMSGPAFGDANIGSAKGLALATKSPHVLAWNEKLLCVWNLSTGACMGTMKASEEGTQPWAVEIRDAAITGDGTGVVYLDGMDVSFWSLLESNSRILGTYDGDPPRHIAISPDGQFALSSGGDRQVHIWRLSASRRPTVESRLRTSGWVRFVPDANYWPDAHDKPSTMVFVGPNEAIVTTGGGELFALEIQGGPSGHLKLEGKRFEDRHDRFVSEMLVHPNGRLLVTSSHDGAVKLWDLTSRHSTGVLDAHPGTVQQLSASGERILLYTRDGVLKVVSLRDGALLAAFQVDKQIITSAADVEIQHVVARDQGGQVHFLYLEQGFSSASEGR